MPDGHTVNVSVCEICDQDRNPLDVPAEPCGHGPARARLVAVPVIPLPITDEMVEKAAQGLASVYGQGKPSRLDRKAARAALHAALNTTEEQKP